MKSVIVNRLLTAEVKYNRELYAIISINNLMQQYFWIQGHFKSILLIINNRKPENKISK